MDRPALNRLLADIGAGKIDCVVVYRVDLLSCNLLDFARIMEARSPGSTSRLVPGAIDPGRRDRELRRRTDPRYQPRSGADRWDNGPGRPPGQGIDRGTEGGAGTLDPPSPPATTLNCGSWHARAASMVWPPSRSRST